MAAGQAANAAKGAFFDNMTVSGRRNISIAVLTGWAVALKLALGGSSKKEEPAKSK